MVSLLTLNTGFASTTSVSIQAFVNLIWALADLAIVFTFFKFGRAELPRFVTKSMFAV